MEKEQMQFCFSYIYFTNSKSTRIKIRTILKSKKHGFLGFLISQFAVPIFLTNKPRLVFDMARLRSAYCRQFAPLMFQSHLLW